MQFFPYDTIVFYENSKKVYLIAYAGKEANPVLPNKFNNKIYAIYKYAFFDNTTIANVTIPNSVTSIGNSVFRGTGLRVA